MKTITIISVAVIVVCMISLFSYHHGQKSVSQAKSELTKEDWKLIHSRVADKFDLYVPGDTNFCPHLIKKIPLPTFYVKNDRSKIAVDTQGHLDEYWDIYFANDSVNIGVTVMWDEEKIRLMNGKDIQYINRRDEYKKTKWYKK